MDIDHHAKQDGHDHHQADISDATNTATDPVCGMQVALDAGKPTAQYQGQGFHFCSDKCHGKFELDPYFYASGNSKQVKAAENQSTDYTCPMHP